MEYGGYLLIFDEPNRSNSLIEYINDGQSFSDALSAEDWKMKTKEFCFLSFDNKTITHASLAIRKKKVATKKFRVEFDDYINIPPISFEDIEKNLRNKIRQHFVRVSSDNGGRFPPKTWEEMINVIKKLQPDVAEMLDSLEAKRVSNINRYIDIGYDIVAQEKDAVNLALKLFMPNGQTPKIQWSSSIKNVEPAPFISGIIKQKISEDLMIFYDSNNFSNWDCVKRHKIGAMEFINGDQKLTILNCNRTAVEKNLGVDLLYYHHKYQSFVLVQYKKMKWENKKLVYRPNDKSYFKEVESIKSFLLTHPYVNDPPTSVDYRLTPNGFFFKLCEVEGFNPSDNDLIKGMYIPFDYWNILMESRRLIGPKGGISATYNNVERHINNTLFIELVTNGWIGSTRSSTEEIHLIVNQSLSDDKSVIMAFSQDNVV